MQQQPKQLSQAARKSDATGSASWDYESSALLLKLRYEDFKDTLLSTKNKQQLGGAWTILASQLNTVTGRVYSSLQCQSKVRTHAYIDHYYLFCATDFVNYILLIQLKTLKNKWQETTAD